MSDDKARYAECGYIHVCATCRIWEAGDHRPFEQWKAIHDGHDTYATGAVGETCGYHVVIRKGYRHADVPDPDGEQLELEMQ